MDNTLVAPAKPVVAAEEDKYELKLADRCDRCGIASQAFAVATKVIDGKRMDVLLCGHHLREHTPALVAQGFSIQDETHKINAKADGSTQDLTS